MFDELRTLLERLRGASPMAKAVAALAGLAVVAAVAVAGRFASQPHFRLLYSQLDDAQSASVQKALAEAGVRFEVSQPPAPFVIHVEEREYYEAQNAVARSGALERMPAGIRNTDGGAASVFLSAGERRQSVMKREWQEMERQLEALEFVARAVVTTSVPDPSPLADPTAMTASVMLELRGGSTLTREQARTITTLVRFRFNIPADNLVVSDHNGNSLYDPTAGDSADAPRNVLAHAAEYDRELADKANRALALAFGSDRAHVTLTSEWDFDQSTTIQEDVDPSQRAAISEESSKTETPRGGGASPSAGAVGTGANLPADGFGIENAAFAAGGPSGSGSDPVATTKDEKKRFVAGRSTTHRVHSTPTLRRLSVSLFLDQSLAERKSELEEVVKAAVGFESEARRDVLRSIVTPLAETRAADAESSAGQPAEPSGPSPMVELLLERGVEIVAAIGFLFLLVRSLRSARAAPASAPAGTVEVDGEPIDPERLAAARVEELVRSDPARVSEILARWARDEIPAETRP